MRNARNVIIYPPAAVDQARQASYTKDISDNADNFQVAFESAREIEVEQDIGLESGESDRSSPSKTSRKINF